MNGMPRFPALRSGPSPWLRYNPASQCGVLMAMGEGRRRRRMEEGEASGSLEATADATAESDTSEVHQAGVQRRRRARMNQRPAVQPVSEPPSETQISDVSSTISDTTPSKPVALAEILANPSLAMRPIGEVNTSSSEAAVSAESPVEAAQPTFDNSQAEASVQEPHLAERNDTSAPYASTELPGHFPEPSHGEARRTREPAILALLLVALIMLAFNT